MKDDLARYLHQAEWTGAVEGKRFWRSGPRRWLREATRKGLLALFALVFGLGLPAPPAHADASDAAAIERVAHDGEKARNSGAGGN